MLAYPPAPPRPVPLTPAERERRILDGLPDCLQTQLRGKIAWHIREAERLARRTNGRGAGD